MTKADVRRQLRALPALPPDEAAARSRAICERVQALPAWAGARVVALYSASRHEPALDLLWEQDSTRRFAFPRVEGDTGMGEALAFFQVRSAAELLESRWGLHEPVADAAKEIVPAEMDLVLVPGVAFTAAGERLGRGRGHYDRFLPQLRPDAVVIGICFEERLLPSLPSEPHDHRMHAVISA